LQINPGVFNKKIEIVSRLITKDSSGFPIYTDTVVLKTWAQITNTSGTEIQRSNSDFSEVKTRFFMRTSKTRILKDYVIKFNGNFFEIVYVNDYGYGGVYLEIMAQVVEK
jgi:SPP1 family predicted phage head-tail adaptor